MSRWFATQVDRDFINGMYGEGHPRLYREGQCYVLITGISYEKGILKVKDDLDNIIELNTQPDNEYFSNTLLNQWKVFDEKYGKNDENRSDYEPCAYNSLDSLAMELKLLERDGIKIFYGKKF